MVVTKEPDFLQLSVRGEWHVKRLGITNTGKTYCPISLDDAYFLLCANNLVVYKTKLMFPLSFLRTEVKVVHASFLYYVG